MTQQKSGKCEYLPPRKAMEERGYLPPQSSCLDMRKLEWFNVGTRGFHCTMEL